MKEPRKNRSYITEILREKILIDAMERDIVSETVEEALAPRTPSHKTAVHGYRKEL
jgi:hypothetical protein